MDYTESQRIERAERARLLLSDDFFAEMLTTVRLEALNALAEVDPTDISAIHRQQAIVAVTGELKELMTAAVLATGEQDGGHSLDPPSGD